MKNFESVTDKTASHSTRLPNDGNQVAGYKPVMWFTALLLALLWPDVVVVVTEHPQNQPQPYQAPAQALVV